MSVSQTGDTLSQCQQNRMLNGENWDQPWVQNGTLIGTESHWRYDQHSGDEKQPNHFTNNGCKEKCFLGRMGIQKLSLIGYQQEKNRKTLPGPDPSSVKSRPHH